MLLSDAARMAGADAACIQGGLVPSETLMLRAAGHVARAALELMGIRRSAVVFCGRGNNGGDGVAAAEYLLRCGAAVRVFLVGDRSAMSRDSRAMEARLRAAGGEIEDFAAAAEALPELLRSAGVIIDALFGIGLRRPLTGDALRAVELINASGRPVVAADIPSGVSADTGCVLGAAVRAKRTVTFTMAKPGHFLEPGCVYCGRVTVHDIGIPASCLTEVYCGVQAVGREDVSLPARSRLTHKGDYGKVLLLGGSVGYTGAPNLCAAAAVRAGAGLVYLGVPRAIWEVCAVKNREAMPFPLPDDGERLSAEALEAARQRMAQCDVLAMGPGLGRSEGVRSLVCSLAEEARVPLVLDADALWAVAETPEVLRKARGSVVLTPHEGEFRRLARDFDGDRLGAARAFAAEYRCTVVLKGHRCVCAFPEGEAFVICAGNPGMARGGSGDVLTGVLAALAGQLPWKQAVVTACWVHAAAGDRCAAELGEYGMTPSDIIAALPSVLREITEI